MSFQDQLLLWNHAALKVVDVRRSILQPGECLQEHSLPASTFLFALRGKAQVLIDERQYQANPYHVCHAGKGMSLQIVHVGEAFEYYRVLYKATLTMPCREELLRLQQTNNPFQLPYLFAPRHPLPLYGNIEQMHQQWLKNNMLERFHVKALFHQFIFEMLQQRQAHGDDPAHQNLVTHAIRLIEERYAEKMTLNSLADMLDISTRQLQRLFKTGLHIGPMEYLLQVRLEKAKNLLVKMNVPLVQIAESVGYADSYYFSRMFKKYIGVSPSQFKKQAMQSEDCRHNPSDLSRSYIVPKNVPMYSVTDENGFHYQRDVASPSNTHAVPPADSTGYTRNVDPEGGVGETTRTYIKHLKGELKLEQTPERIVVLDYQYIDQLYALGQLPVGSVFGMREIAKLPEELTERLGGIKRVGTKDHPDLKAISEASPDLIICTEIHRSIYHELVKMAPTVMFGRNEDWRLALPVLGKMVGKELEALKIIDEYNQKMIHLKDALAKKMGGKTVSLIRPRDNMIRLHTTAHRTARILYRDLGIAAPSMAVDSKRTSSFIGLDVMPQLNADHLFVLLDDSNEELTNEYQKSAIWKGLNVVKANQVRTFNTTMWIGYYGPIAINRVVDEIAEALL